MGEALQQAKDLLATEVFPGDVIAAILGASELDSLPTNEVFLATVFSEFAKLKPHLFEDFDFSDHSTYPFSDVLQDLLDDLETEHYLGKPNPTYTRHDIQQEQGADWVRNQILAKFERKGWLGDVNELAALLKKKVANHEVATKD